MDAQHSQRGHPVTQIGLPCLQLGPPRTTSGSPSNRHGCPCEPVGGHTYSCGLSRIPVEAHTYRRGSQRTHNGYPRIYVGSHTFANGLTRRSMDSHAIAHKHPPSVMVAQTRSQKSRFGSPQHVATHLCGSPKRSGSWASTNSRWQSRSFSCASRQMRGRPLAKLDKPHAFCGSPVLATRTYGRSRILRTWLHVHGRWRTWRNVGASVTRQVGRWRRERYAHITSECYA